WPPTRVHAVAERCAEQRISRGRGSVTMPGDSLRDALRYWEPRRVWYNVALSVEAAAWVVFTWPHFRPALSLQHLLQLMVLALLRICATAPRTLSICPCRTHSGRRGASGASSCGCAAHSWRWPSRATGLRMRSIRTSAPLNLSILWVAVSTGAA